VMDHRMTTGIASDSCEATKKHDIR
jgi:hypothetical protein